MGRKSAAQVMKEGLDEEARLNGHDPELDEDGSDGEVGAEQMPDLPPGDTRRINDHGVFVRPHIKLECPKLRRGHARILLGFHGGKWFGSHSVDNGQGTGSTALPSIEGRGCPDALMCAGFEIKALVEFTSPQEPSPFRTGVMRWLNSIAAKPFGEDELAEIAAVEREGQTAIPDRTPEPAAAAPAKPPEFRMLHVAQIFRNAHNKRVFHKDDPDLDELAASIRENGVLQPVLVRPLPGKAEGAFELIAGERRWRASEKAGKTEIPCMVHSCSDKDVLVFMALENGQRKDLRPMEAARAIELLVEAGMSMEEAASRLGWSQRQFAQRVLLTQLLPAIAEAADDPATQLYRWGIEKLLLVARLPRSSQHAWWVREKGHLLGLPSGFGHGLTTNELEHDLRHFMHDLSEVGWSLKDAELVPSQGACTACVRRSDRQPDLFDGVAAGEDGKPAKGARCLDAKCFEQKTAANIAAKARELREKHGKDVLFVGRKESLPAGCGVKPEEVKEEHRLQLRPAKKTDPDARPVLKVSGYGGGIGRTTWMAPARGGSGVSRVAPSLEDRKRAVLEKRAKMLREKLTEAIRAIVGDACMDPRKVKVDRTMVQMAAIAAAAGAEPEAYIAGRRCMHFADRVALSGSGKTKPEEVAGQLWLGILNSLDNSLSSDPRELDQVGEQCLATVAEWIGIGGQEFEAAMADVAAKFPMPKAEDGKKKAAATSGKSAKKAAAKKKAAAGGK